MAWSIHLINMQANKRNKKACMLACREMQTQSIGDDTVKFWGPWDDFGYEAAS